MTATDGLVPAATSTGAEGWGLRPVRDPDAEALVRQFVAAGGPLLSERGVAGARAYLEQSAAAGAPGPHVERVEDRRIDVDGRTVPVRVHAPASEAPLPTVVYCHGGGFVIGSVAASDAFARRLAVAGPCVVVSVDYRLAPEHPFPAGIEDAVAALDWTAEHAGELGGDPGRVVALGDSAGATLTAAAVRRVTAAGRRPVRRQVLAYPGAGVDRARTTAFGGEWPLTDVDSAWFAAQYLPEPSMRSDPDSALLTADVTGVPPTTLLLGGCDPLMPEGLAYAAHLTNAGVSVDLHLYAGQIHGFLTFPDTALPRSREALGVVTNAIRNA
ncbi:alpha/beta hydrolase [Trujillonella endophytica]|uniref:Acetyl esterase n=1 Tax=Trujillonella endophytica TaxID=673521 RepID=A0A1H8Q6K0_9ACTN|nr:alpha/beta hydrolase [Trujillella endophytica]SEO49840.1 acetyl esterase [Trujillella endophytica]